MPDITNKILDIFERINRIPRCSKKEERISKWLEKWARDRGLEVKVDESLNLCIKVPASKGYEDSPVVILQGHMDMVCEKNEGTEHDFDNDPIKHIVEGDWLRADGTTLGADNGIAIAMAMAVAEDETLEHPPLELLFTVDEEQGLSGANKLGQFFIEGKRLINIDSEDDDVFTVGCSGGQDTRLSIPLIRTPCPERAVAFRVKVDGLHGGHSGIDIDKQRANAIKLLTRLLFKTLICKKIPLRISSFQAGKAHNAIPREASAVIVLPEDRTHDFKELAAVLGYTYQAEYKNQESAVDITVEEVDLPETVIEEDDNEKALRVLTAIPQGVLRMSDDIEGLVETSTNLAVVSTDDYGIEIVTSQRSSIASRLEEAAAQIRSVCVLAGGEATVGSSYPSWPADMNSELLARGKEVYRRLNNEDPVVEIIHAGLECAVIGSKFSDMDMISIGPTIRDPHSPREKLHIPSVPKVWNFLSELLKELK